MSTNVDIAYNLLTTVVSAQLEHNNLSENDIDMLYDSIVTDFKEHGLGNHTIVLSKSRNGSIDLKQGKYFQYIIFPDNKVSVINKFF